MRRSLSSLPALALVPVLLPMFAGCGSDQGSPSETERIGSTSEALTESCGQPENGPVQGYDVSEHQGDNFDWMAAKAKGVSFGYARISYGTGHPDLTFDGNWARIKEAGLLRGAYQYFLPNQDVATQAQIVIDKVGKLGIGDLPVQFDVEPTQAERGGLTGAQIAAKMRQWLDLVEAGTGKRPFIYTNAYLWQDFIGSTEFGNYGLWIANYHPPSGCPKINDGWSKWTIWQYSDTNATLDRNVFNGTLAELQAFAGTAGEDYPTLARRSVADINGDGQADVCARAIRGLVCALSNGDKFLPQFNGPAWSDEAGWSSARYRETIQFGDIDGDGKADVCGRFTAGVLCKRSDGTNFTTDVPGPAWTDDKGWSQPSSYTTMQLADVNGDGKLDICGRASSGLVCNLSDGNGFPTEIQGPAWSDQAGWNKAEQYATIQLADINGDGQADACARDAEGIVCHLSKGNGFPAEVRGPAWSNAAGWSKVEYGSTIRFVDVDGDGRADVCGRGPAGIVCAVSKGRSFDAEFAGPGWSDQQGWNKPSSYRTIQWGDINGDKKADVCGRAASGMVCHLSEGATFSNPIDGPAFSDTEGWADAKYFTTMALGDVNHDGKEDLCARSAAGVICTPSTGSGFGDKILAADWSDAKGWGAAPYYNSTRVIGSSPLAKFTGVVEEVEPGPNGDADGGATEGKNNPRRLGSTAPSSGCAVGPVSTNSRSSSMLGGIVIAFGLVLRRRRDRCDP
ncbi:MAG TPA: GH25 family lysozyme [Labilithrix sp.]|nr:GH25 family lysozyme [Labilithrix sp.]